MSDQPEGKARTPRAAPNHRECGECTACCLVMGVKELDKAPYSPCQHTESPTCAAGCAIYNDRPKSCADYGCLWLLIPDQVPIEWRPDKVGLVLWKQDDTKFGPVVTAFEVWSGASEQPNTQFIIQWLQQNHITLLANPAERRLLVPASERDRVLAIIQEMQSGQQDT